MNSFLQSTISTLISQFAFQKAKKKALVIYLKVLQSTRRSLMLVLLVFMILQMFILSFCGLMITVIWLLPNSDLITKLYWLLGFFALLFFVSFSALGILLSEKSWFKFSGVDKIVDETVS